MKWQGILLYVISILSTLFTDAQPPTHTGYFEPFIDENINGFWEYLPRNYQNDINTRYPLLIFMHGAGDMGNGKEQNVLHRVLRNGPPRLINQGAFPDSFFVNGRWYKFIVLSPQIKNGINGNTSTIAPSTIEALIEYAKDTYRIDTSKIYLSGLSMGGGATWDYAGSSVSAASRLAAIIVACGAADLSQQEANNIAAAKLPVLSTHNMDDDVIMVIRTQNNIKNILNYQPIIDPLPRAIYWSPPPAYGHNVWRRTFESLAAGSLDGGNVTDTLGINAYQWALQYARVNVQLPVNWIEFSASRSNNGIDLQWKVSAQDNLQDYRIERSEDARKWNEVATLKPKWGSYEVVYAYNDISTAKKVYYRIKANDVDGRFTYSVVRFVNADFGSRVSVYPNPFAGNISVHLPQGLSNVIDLRLIDEQGKIVFAKKYQLNNSTLNVTGLSELKKGNYFLQLTADSGQILLVKKLSKQ